MKLERRIIRCELSLEQARSRPDEATHTKMISLARNSLSLATQSKPRHTCATDEQRLFVAETHIGLRLQTDYYNSWRPNEGLQRTRPPRSGCNPSVPGLSRRGPCKGGTCRVARIFSLGAYASVP